MSEGPDLHQLAGLRSAGRRRGSGLLRSSRGSPPAPPEGGQATPAWLLVAVQLLAVAAVAFYASRHPLVPTHGIEGDAYWRYLLHALVGLGLGLAFAAIVAGVRRGGPSGVAGWAVLGGVLAVIPDLLATFAGQPHRAWMDYFLAHLSIDTAPQPLLVGLGVFVLGGWAWWAAARRRLWAALVLVLATAGLFAGALLTHSPLPADLAVASGPYGVLTTLG